MSLLRSYQATKVIGITMVAVHCILLNMYFQFCSSRHIKDIVQTTCDANWGSPYILLVSYFSVSAQEN